MNQLLPKARDIYLRWACSAIQLALFTLALYLLATR